MTTPNAMPRRRPTPPPPPPREPLTAPLAGNLATIRIGRDSEPQPWLIRQIVDAIVREEWS